MGEVVQISLVVLLRSFLVKEMMIIGWCKKLYKEEFDEAKEEYNLKQIRDDRKIKDLYTHNIFRDKTIESIQDDYIWNKENDKNKNKEKDDYEIDM